MLLLQHCALHKFQPAIMIMILITIMMMTMMVIIIIIIIIGKGHLVSSVG